MVFFACPRVGGGSVTGRGRREQGDALSYLLGGGEYGAGLYCYPAHRVFRVNANPRRRGGLEMGFDLRNILTGRKQIWRFRSNVILDVW